VRVARPVRRAGRRNPPTEMLAGRSGPTPTPTSRSRKGFLYLVAVMDWHSRKVLSWRVSNTMTTDFCVAALTEALALYGTPDIFNTDSETVIAGVR
jgi:transposase InsO family protein